MKSLVKELFIGVMLLMIVVFTLGIIFYDSMPNNKLAPTSITYTADATVTSTIQQIAEEKSNSSNNSSSSSDSNSSGIDFGSVIASYSIGSTDLSIYESRKNYESGKSDPFEDYVEETTDDEDGNNNNSGDNNGGNNSSSDKGNSNNSSSGKLFENKYTK